MRLFLSVRTAVARPILHTPLPSVLKLVMRSPLPSKIKTLLASMSAISTLSALSMKTSHVFELSHAEFAQKLAADVEHLSALVAVVGHHELASSGQTNAAWTVQFPITA